MTQRKYRVFSSMKQVNLSIHLIQYISENMNRDICVAVWIAGAVVVVDQAEQYRFTYKGPQTTPQRLFYPRGITTDSQIRILVSDS